MEDFTLARPNEGKQTSALHNEWMDSQLAKAQVSKLELAALSTLQDKPHGPGKDVADRIDKELRDFANAKSDNASPTMQSFQKMVGKFCDTANKQSAIEELGESYSKLKVQLEKDADATYKERNAEAAKQPGRQALEAEFSSKLDVFFDKVNKLPAEKGNKVYDLLDWRDGETRLQHQERVRAGLKDDKDLLGAFNSLESTADKLEASKSAREKELDAVLTQQISDYRTMQPLVEKAYIRSTINY